jgi:hypothetical protein
MFYPHSSGLIKWSLAVYPDLAAVNAERVASVKHGPLGEQCGELDPQRAHAGHMPSESHARRRESRKASEQVRRTVPTLVVTTRKQNQKNWGFKPLTR